MFLFCACTNRSRVFTLAVRSRACHLHSVRCATDKPALARRASESGDTECHPSRPCPTAYPARRYNSLPSTPTPHHPQTPRTDIGPFIRRHSRARPLSRNNYVMFS
ncbi:hypothetical protein EVAR_61756_1 [Eumeta japonica]|uniref:Uncharacterized protein n=1 Tax=Eumeta variegata TaxID=151549 RepID=A0A4C1ZF05_EUMVA|nr:hypothetical protein EVAR_61756_1 [Eumeta japonica]